MKAQEPETRIFLDGGNPQETRELKDTLGFLHGQTTNPTFDAFAKTRSRAAGYNLLKSRGQISRIRAFATPSPLSPKIQPQF